MFNIRYISSALAVASLAAVLAGCSDNDKWQPGPAADPDCMAVYFGELASYNIIVEPDDSRLIPVTVGRSQTDLAAVVPITVVECPEGAVVPESVEFAAGQQAATFYVDIENMPSKSSGSFSLTLPEEMTSPYGAGTTGVTFTVTISGAWIPVAESVVLSTEGVYPDMESALYYLDGTDNFKIPDFFGSGLDFVFTMVDPGNGWTEVRPVKNFRDAPDAYTDLGFGSYTYDGGWFLYDDALADYPYWSPDGVTYPEVDYLEFDYAYSYMQLIEDEDNNGYIYFGPYAYMADGSGKYLDMTFSFKTIFSPYTDVESTASAKASRR